MSIEKDTGKTRLKLLYMLVDLQKKSQQLLSLVNQ